MTLFLTVLHVMVCLILIIVVLLQRGKGAEIGAVFGGGASTTVFGSRGAGNFMSRLTTGAAVTFMVTSLLLAYSARERAGSSVFAEEDVTIEGTSASEDGGGFQEVGEPIVPAPEAGIEVEIEGTDDPSEAPGAP